MNDSADNFDKPLPFKKGQVLFTEGEASTLLYIIVSGEVCLFKEDKGRLIPLTLAGPKEFVGELTMFTDEPRNAVAIASKNSQLMIIKKTEIKKVMKLCPDWVSDIMITLSDRLRSTGEVLREHQILGGIDEVSDGRLSAEDMALFQKNLKDYKSRRGIN